MRPGRLRLALPKHSPSRPLATQLVSFFFIDPATTEIYTLSLHDALPIYRATARRRYRGAAAWGPARMRGRSEEHTSELQSLTNIVCRLLLEKKKALTGRSRLRQTP